MIAFSICILAIVIGWCADDFIKAYNRRTDALINRKETL